MTPARVEDELVSDVLIGQLHLAADEAKPIAATAIYKAITELREIERLRKELAEAVTTIETAHEAIKAFRAMSTRDLLADYLSRHRTGALTAK